MIFSLRKRYVFLGSRAIAIVTANLFIYIFFILEVIGVDNYVTYLLLMTLEQANLFHIGCKNFFLKMQ